MNKSELFFNEKNKPLFSFLVELMIGGWTGAILGWTVATGVFDARFFTYFTYALGFSFYLFIFLSETESELHEWLILLTLPIYTCLTIFVYIAIVVIVYKNDWVIIRDSVFAGGDLSLGEVHTGDWLFHYLPPFTMLVYTLVNYVPISATNYLFWSEKSKRAKFTYVAYVFLTPMLILGCYMVTMPFDSNYPTKMRTWQVCVLVFGLSAAIQAIYIAGSYSVAMTLGKFVVNYPNFVPILE